MRRAPPLWLATSFALAGAACGATAGGDAGDGGGSSSSAGGDGGSGPACPKITGSCYGSVSCPVGSVCEEDTFTCCQFGGEGALSPPSCLSIVPGSLDFGTVGLNPATKSWCSSPARTVQLINACPNDIKATAISVSDDAGTTPPFVLSDMPNLPADLPAFGAPVTFQITFQPTSQGVQNGTAEVGVEQNNGGYLLPAGSLQVPLLGDAQPDGQETDSFTVASGSPQVDLLLVFDNDDNSGNSTASYETFAKNAIPALFQAAQAANIDYQIAVTDDDTCQDTGSDHGRLEPCAGCAATTNPADGSSTNIFTSQNPKAEAELAALVPHDTYYCTGGLDEQMLDAFYLALQPSLLDKGGANAGFLRPSARLAVLEIDDDPEDDHSVLLGSVQAYYDFLVGLKGDPGQVSYSYINYAGVGTQEVSEGELVKLSGGVQSDMSETTWISDLSTIWSTATAIGHTIFPLDGDPVASSLAVTVDGTAIPASGWSYVATSNSIQFASSSAPAAGQTVAVSYTTVCN